MEDFWRFRPENARDQGRAPKFLSCAEIAMPDGGKPCDFGARRGYACCKLPSKNEERGRTPLLAFHQGLPLSSIKDLRGGDSEVPINPISPPSGSERQDIGVMGAYSVRRGLRHLFSPQNPHCTSRQKFNLMRKAPDSPSLFCLRTRPPDGGRFTKVYLP